MHKKETEQKQKRQNKKRKPKEELKQSTNSYKFYCGVEHSRARCLKKVIEYFQPALKIVLIETIEGTNYLIVLAQISIETKNNYIYKIQSTIDNDVNMSC